MRDKRGEVIRGADRGMSTAQLFLRKRQQKKGIKVYEREWTWEAAKVDGAGHRHAAPILDAQRALTALGAARYVLA